MADSCGFGVPLYEYKGERGELEAWSERKGTAGLREYREKKNATSIDGLGGLTRARHSLRAGGVPEGPQGPGGKGHPGPL